MKRILSLWFFLASIAVCCATAGPPRSLTQADRDDICEAAFKYYGKSGGFRSDLMFLSMPGGIDPSDDFMKRFRDYQPKAEKKSMATHDGPPARQVRHKVTGQAGVVVYAGEPSMQTNGSVRVEMSYDMFSLGGGHNSLILSRSNAVWSVIEKIPGVVY
jgi:hypothetical protein